MKYTWLLFLSLLLISCAGEKPLYYWKDYQLSLYKILESPTMSVAAKIKELEHIKAKAESQRTPVPPGLYANLGMLYAKEGKVEEAKANYRWEKRFFPESTTYMDFLINGLATREDEHDQNDE